MRVLLTGGGTAGHINPAIAIANYIKEKEKDSEFLFIGTEKGLEKKLVPKSGYDIKYIEVSGLKRKLTLENIKVFENYVKSIQDSSKILKSFKPDVVVGTGGYVCAPVIKAAFRLKIPTLIHEQNVFPGLAIKMLSSKADVTAISFDETKEMMKAKKMVLTGNPLRPDLFEEIDKEGVRKTFGFDSKPLVLMFGGSLGAECINNALTEMVAKGIKSFNLISATGERNYESVRKKLEEKNIDVKDVENAVILPYIYNMEDIFGASDLIIGRAGAITISEITALSKPSILIPSPYVAHNHQEYNARYLEKNGASKVISEKELTGEGLLKEIERILHDGDSFVKMQINSGKIGIKDACEKIYTSIKSITK